MEGACSLDRAPSYRAFGSIILKQPYQKSPPISANYLCCSNGYPSFTSSRSPICSPILPTFTSFGKHLDGPLDLSSHGLVALNTFECLAETFETESSTSLIHTSSGRSIFSVVDSKGMASGSRGGTGNFSQSLMGYNFNSEWRKISSSGGESSSPCSSRAIVARTMRFPVFLESKSHRNIKVTCLAHRFGAISPCAEEWPQLFMLSFGGRGKGRPHVRLHQLCEATGQSSTGQPAPDEEFPESAKEQGPPPVPGKNAELPVVSPVESETPEVDWRAFRARLVVTEHVATSSETDTKSAPAETGSIPVSSLGKRWAHPILAPEAGCVLIATDKIDGQQSFERSVILLLSPGSTNPLEGPYGLILNRPLSCRIKDIKPKDRTLIKFFGNCQVHHGGPLDEDMFLLLHGTQGVKGYREVIPGVYYGAASGLEEIMKGKRPLDYRFFFGYSGWGVEQLRKEIDAGLWCVAACSTDLITGHSAAGLWEEILLLMGGKYGELSKRPRRRHF